MLHQPGDWHLQSCENTPHGNWPLLGGLLTRTPAALVKEYHRLKFEMALEIADRSQCSAP